MSSFANLSKVAEARNRRKGNLPTPDPNLKVSNSDSSPKLRSGSKISNEKPLEASSKKGANRKNKASPKVVIEELTQETIVDKLAEYSQVSICCFLSSFLLLTNV